jgi:hypothetical protein
MCPSIYLYRFFSDFSDFVAQLHTHICSSSNFQDVDYTIPTPRRLHRLAIASTCVLLCPTHHYRFFKRFYHPAPCAYLLVFKLSECRLYYLNPSPFMPLGHRFTVCPSAHLSTYLYRFFSDFSDFVAQFRTLICLSSNFQDMDYSILSTRRSRRLAIT